MWAPNNLSGLEAAMRSQVRRTDFRAELFSKTFQPLSIKLRLMGGTLDGDLTQRKSAPMWRCAANVINDPNLPEASSGVWYSWNLSIVVRIFTDGGWIEIPRFFGPIQDVTPKGKVLQLDAASKEIQHLDPHLQVEPFTLPENQRGDQAIHRLFSQRGETRFHLDRIRQRLDRPRPVRRGAEAWRIGQIMADDFDRFLYYRGDGRLRFTEWPTMPAWTFRDAQLLEEPEIRNSIDPVRDTFIVQGSRTVKVEINKKTELTEKSIVGATEIKLKNVGSLSEGERLTIGGAGGNPETRRVAGSWTPGSKTVPLSVPLNRNHAKGAVVKYTIKEDRERRVSGVSKIGTGQLSANAISDGKRPRVELHERPGVHSKERAENVAKKIRDRHTLRLDQEIGLSSIAIWHLELGDIFRVSVDGRTYRSRIKRMSFGLDRASSMEIGWQGRRKPSNKKHRGRKR